MEVCLLLLSLLVSMSESYIDSDWLLTPPTQETTFHKLDSDTYRLTNGLITRDFLVNPGFITLDMYSLEQDTSLLRALSPEAEVVIGGEAYNVGGVLCDMPRGYLNRTDLRNKLRPDPESFRYFTHSVGPISEDISYTPRRHAPSSITWPPPGLHLVVRYKVWTMDSLSK